LARRAGRTRSSIKDEPVTLGSIVAALPEYTLCVEYLRYGYDFTDEHRKPEYVATVLSRDSGPLVIALGSAGKIDSLVSTYRTHLESLARIGEFPSASDLVEYDRIALSLHSILIEPFAAEVKRTHRMTVAPDGLLNSISFAGLVDSSGVYVTDRVAVQYGTTLRDLVRTDRETATGHGLLAVGGVDYDATPQRRTIGEGSANELASRGLSFRSPMRSSCDELYALKVQPLPHSLDEVNRVAAAWRHGTGEKYELLSGGEASEGRLKASAPGKRVLHLATHGFFLGESCNSGSDAGSVSSLSSFRLENPLLQSGLLLAGANLHGAGCDSLKIDDGILSAYEVAAMDLRGVEVVVLSACESAMGAVRPNEGMYGLRRAFTIAGAHSTIGALWSVPDELTSEMTDAIYAPGSSETIPERLQEMMARARSRLHSLGVPEHPLLWAGFVYYGN